MAAVPETCASCGRADASMRCAWPCTQRYCGRACQREDWPEHKHECFSRNIKFPAAALIQAVVRELLIARREADVPRYSALGLGQIATLDGLRYQTELASGPTCSAFLDRMVREMRLFETDGYVHTKIREALDGPDAGSKFIVVLHIRSLSLRGVLYEEIRDREVNNRDNKGLVVLKPRAREQCSKSTVMMRILTYDIIKESHLMASVLPCLLRPSVPPGSKKEDALIRHIEALRRCSACGQSDLACCHCIPPMCWECGLARFKAGARDGSEGRIPRCVHCGFAWRLHDWVENACAPSFASRQCCWCANRTAAFRCRCEMWDYCSPECCEEHGRSATNPHLCEQAWFVRPLPSEGSCLKYVGGEFVPYEPCRDAASIARSLPEALVHTILPLANPDDVWDRDLLESLLRASLESDAFAAQYPELEACQDHPVTPDIVGVPGAGKELAQQTLRSFVVQEAIALIERHARLELEMIGAEQSSPTEHAEAMEDGAPSPGDSGLVGNGSAKKSRKQRNQRKRANRRRARQEENRNTCPVCMERDARCVLIGTVIEDSCGHFVCQECANLLLDRGMPCPTCRTPFKHAVRTFL